MIVLKHTSRKKLDIPFDGIEIDEEKVKLAKLMIEKNIYNPFRGIHRKPEWSLEKICG